MTSAVTLASSSKWGQLACNRRQSARHLSEHLGVGLGVDERMQRRSEPCARLGVGGLVLGEGDAHIRREQLNSQYEGLEAEVRIGGDDVLVGRRRRLRLRLRRLSGSCRESLSRQRQPVGYF